MKKILSALLALCLLIGPGGALAEELPVRQTSTPVPAPVQEPVQEPVAETIPEPVAATSTEPATFVVGGANRLTGNFFSEIFGGSVADQDARMLLHGYDLVAWQSREGVFALNDRVVSGMVVLEDAEGNRTYTLSLYDDLRYSDGTTITAADYVFSILLSLSPQLAALGAQPVYGDYFVGSDEYMSGASDALSGVRLLNDAMFSVTVKADYEPFFYGLAMLDYNPYPISVIAPGCQVVDAGAGAKICNINAENTSPLFSDALLSRTMFDPETGYVSHPAVVSGPYALESYDEPNSAAVFTANPYFKGDNSGRTATIPRLAYCCMDPQRGIAALADGEIHLYGRCASARDIVQGINLANSGAGFQGQSYARNGLSFISFNCERPGVASVAVRQAIAHCLNKQAMTTSYTSNFGSPMEGYYGMGQWMYLYASGEEDPPLSLAWDANEEEMNAYADALAEWDQVRLDFSGLKYYSFDVEEAIRVLESDGWTVNHSGEEYNYAWDDMRYKEINGEYVPLKLTMYYPEGSVMEDIFGPTFLQHLDMAGIVLVAEARPMSELLDIYYRRVERDCDMIYLATNFPAVFDMTSALVPEDPAMGVRNRTGLTDETLYQLALDMRSTRPGDVLDYCRKWVKFQERWMELLPAIPVYSNLYFDFSTDHLEGYDATREESWAEGILGATWLDAGEWQAATTVEPAAEASVTPPVGWSLDGSDAAATTAMPEPTATVTAQIDFWQPGAAQPPTAAPVAPEAPAATPTPTVQFDFWQPGEMQPPTVAPLG